MIDVSRRAFAVSAASASAAFGLKGPIELIAPAFADARTGTDEAFHTFKLGDLDVTTLYDGIWEKPHDPGFVKNASVNDVKAALRAAGYSGENVPIPFTITLIKKGDKTIMFDSGTGAQLAPTAGKLSGSMAAAGIDPKSINTIIVTHFHPDHIFGLMEKVTNAQVYPSAEIIVPAAEMAFWGDESVFNKIPEQFHGLAKRIQATFPSWKNVTRVEGEKEVSPGIRAIPAYGHTPGHTVFIVGSGKEQLMVLADTTNLPALFAKNPGWHSTFDADATAAEANRRRLFDRAIADGAIVTGYHYGMPGAGRMQKDGAGYAFVPLA